MLQASRMYVRSMVMVSSSRSNFAPVTASAFHCKSRERAGWSFNWSMSVIAGAMFPLPVFACGVGLLLIGYLARLIYVPIEYTLLPDVEEADQHDTYIYDHLPKAEEAGTGDSEELFVNHCPGNEEDGFHVEQDEQHGHEVELY